MATNTVKWCTETCLDCGGSVPASVVLCVPAAIVYPPVSTTHGFVDATLVGVRPSTDRDYCGSCKTVYTFEFEDSQLLPGTTFKSAYIKEVFCGCLTDFIGQGGPTITVSVTDSESVDLTLNHVGDNYDIQADVNISADPGNIISIEPDGLFAAGGGDSCCVTEGDVLPVMEGVVAFMEGAGDVALPIQGSIADGILVNLGANNDVTVTGTVNAVQSGVWAVDVNTLPPITGTVTANQGGAWNIGTVATITNPVTVTGTVDVGTITNPVTVVATNLDIRDLVAATDSVTIHGDVGVADQFNLTNSDPFAVAIVDANGDQITSFGSGIIQYTDGDVDATVTGTAIMWKDAGNVITSVSAATPLPVDVGTVTVTGTVNAVQSGTWDINDITGTISLPTGAATETTLAALEAHFNDVGISNAPTLKGFGVLNVGGHYIGSDQAEAGSTDTVFNMTAHSIRVGDYLLAWTGLAANLGSWSTVESVTVNTVTFAYPFPAAPNAADTYLYYRPTPIAVSNSTGNAGGMMVNIDGDYQESVARGILKPEGNIHNSGDYAVPAWGVRNDNGAVTFTGDGRYSPIAVDANGRVGISDLGGSITVDGVITSITNPVTVTGTVDVGTITNPVTVTATDLDIRDLDCATDSVAICGDVGAVNQFNLTNSDPIAMAVVDANGDQITSFGGGTQYTDGDVDASVTGTAIMWKDAGNVITSVSASTPLPVDVGTVTVTATNLDIRDLTSVSDSVSAVQSGTWNINNISGTVSLPTGAATEATLAGVLTTTDFQARINTLGQKTMANSTPVVLASDQSEITVDTIDKIATGTLAGVSQVVTLSDLDGVGLIGVQTVSTGFDGSTITYEATTDGTNYTSLTMYRIDSNSFFGTGLFGTSQHVCTANRGYTAFRIRCTSYDAGSLAVTIIGTVGSADWMGQAPLPTGSNTIGNVTVSAGVNVQGNIAHDTADSGNPVKIGGVAVSGSATPTSVAAGDRTRAIFNQAGIPYTMAGHPNLITREYDFGTAAQTDVNLAAAVVAADERVYVTRFEALCDNANTVAVSVRSGFGTANVPAASATGVSGMIASHPGIAPGSGIICGTGAGIIGVGGAGEEPRLTSSAATSGNLHVVISYYLIDETP